MKKRRKKKPSRMTGTFDSYEKFYGRYGTLIAIIVESGRVPWLVTTKNRRTLTRRETTTFLSDLPMN